VNGKRYTAPKAVTSEHEAWAWHKSIVEGSMSVTGGDLRVAELCELYLAWDEKRVSADQRDARSHDLTVIKLTRVCKTVVGGVKVGKLPATSIKGQHLKSMLLEWQGAKKNGKRLSVNYCRDLASTFKAVFNWAVGQDQPLVPSYPFTKTPLPKAPKPASRFATRKEAAPWLRFLWRKGLRDFAFLQRCLIHSGARPSELTRATWDEVDWNGWKNKAGHSGAIVTRTEWKSARKTGEDRRVLFTGLALPIAQAANEGRSRP
jgi:integrase